MARLNDRDLRKSACLDAIVQIFHHMIGELVSGLACRFAIIGIGIENDPGAPGDAQQINIKDEQRKTRSAPLKRNG